MKRISEKKKIKWWVQQNYKFQFLLVPKLKTSKLLKLILVELKANSSILMRLEMEGMAKNKQKFLIFIVVPRVRVENQISRIS